MLGARTTYMTLPEFGQAARKEVERPSLREWEVGRSHYEESLATVAHELRSPLATILYALETMADRGEGDSVARQAREIAERQARRAARIIDDLFDVCAGSHGKLSLHKEVVDVAGVVAAAVETADHLLGRRGHRLTVSLPPRPLFVLADPLRLEQVLTNLMANAAKFTDPGGHIRLTAEVEAGYIVLRVRDDGLGIAPHVLPRVFDLFSQGSAFGGPRSCGLGIGLALVKSLVELHGGRVTAFSEGVGRGAEFVVQLPATRSTPGVDQDSPDTRPMDHPGIPDVK
jgi:signal transduction histidine kinase